VAEAEAGAAGIVHLGEHTLKAFLDFGVKLDSIADQLKKLREDEAAYQYGTLDHTVAATGEMPATGSLFLDLGGPAPFRMWQLRRLVVGGITYALAAAGSAIVHVSPSVPNPSSLLTVVDQAASLPLPALYSTHQIVLHAGERLYVEIAGGTSGQTYAAAGSVEDSADRRRRAVTDL
jgi:hypothetical protein